MARIIQAEDRSRQLYYEINTERAAILDLIAWTEGTDRQINATQTGYNILYTGRTFIPGRDHPKIRIRANGITSSAAGRYQFLDFTWNGLQARLRATGFQPFPNFTKIYQDQAALFLIDWKRNAMSEVNSRSLTAFLDKCSWEWASLPNPATNKSRYPQPVVGMSQVRSLYNQFLTLWA